MSWELDYAKAWRELYWPAYKCLSRDLRELFHRVADECKDLHQEQNLWMTWPSDDSPRLHGYNVPLRHDFDFFDAENLAWASHVIYFLGHFFPYGGLEPLGLQVMFLEDADHISDGFWGTIVSKQFGGAHWKFSLYADEVLSERIGLSTATVDEPSFFYWVDSGMLVLRHNTTHSMTNYTLGFATRKQLLEAREDVLGTHPDRIEVAVKRIRSRAMEDMSIQQRDATELKPKFYIHKEGTSLDDEELEWKYRSIVRDAFYVRGVSCVNHKPHPFTVGPKHMVNSGGIYLDPDSAPCAYKEPGTRSTCQLSYKEHTSGRALFLECKRDVANDEAARIIGMIDPKDGLDGVAIVENHNGYKILEAESG